MPYTVIPRSNDRDSAIVGSAGVIGDNYGGVVALRTYAILPRSVPIIRSETNLQGLSGRHRLPRPLSMRSLPPPSLPPPPLPLPSLVFFQVGRLFTVYGYRLPSTVLFISGTVAVGSRFARSLNERPGGGGALLLSHFRLDANYVSRKPPINRRVSVWIPIERIRETPVIESVRINGKRAGGFLARDLR